MVDAAGVGMADQLVSLRGAGANLASTTTNANGEFQLAGVQGGVYEVSAGGNSTVLRVWTAEASPPSANGSVLLVGDGTVTRGQFFKGFSGGGFAGVAVMGALIGGTVAAGVIAESESSS